jgi:CBS domain-containing protein
MLFPVERLIQGRGKPLCVKQDQTVREALALMVENDYSQLPVQDEHGRLTGLISDEAINRLYYHLEAAVPLLDLTVDHCTSSVVTLRKDRDIFEALDRLKDVYAIVITDEDGIPVGILTDYDMAHFFRDLTEDLLIVEDIEISLRQIVQTVYADEDLLKRALIHSFGESEQHPGEPNKSFERLSFGMLMRLITHPANWKDFERVFGHRELFDRLMDHVRQNRNQLAHFRGQLDTLQHDVLKNAQNWLAARPKLRQYQTTHVSRTEVQQAQASRSMGGGKFSALQSFLEQQAKRGISNLEMDFDTLEEIIQDELPEAARSHSSWWNNDYSTHAQATTWLSAGYLVDNVDLNAEKVFLRQTRVALYPLFFDDMLKRLKNRRPGITQVSKAYLDNNLPFSIGTGGFGVGWVLPKEPVLRVDLYIDRGNEEWNKAAFDLLYAQKDEIEKITGEALTWDRLEGRRASRIWTSRPFTLQDPPEKWEQVKEWGVDMMLRFFKAFQSRVRQLGAQGA